MKPIARAEGGIPVALVYGPVALALVALPVLAKVSGEPISLFTRDVFSIAEVPVYAGLYSNLGVFLWFSTVVVAAFAAWLAGPDPEGWRGARGALIGFGGMSAILMVDDFLLVHEWLAPEFLGIPETVVFAAYGALLAGLLVAFRRALLRHGPAHLMAALALFGASLVLDILERPPAPAWHYLVEESLKLLGIAAWATFFWGLAAAVARAGPGSGAVSRA